MVCQLHSPDCTARAYAQSINSNASAAAFNRINVSNTGCAEVGDARGSLVFLQVTVGQAFCRILIHICYLAQVSKK